MCLLAVFVVISSGPKFCVTVFAGIIAFPRVSGHVIVEARLWPEIFVAYRTLEAFLLLVLGSDMITQHGRGLSGEITLLAGISAVPVVVATMQVKG